MLAFDFDSILIIKIILIAHQPKVLEYCSCESYILITFLITLKNCSDFLSHPTCFILKSFLLFLIVTSKITSRYTKTVQVWRHEKGRLFMINAFSSLSLHPPKEMGFLYRFLTNHHIT